jgi:hypothetical protein
MNRSGILVLVALAFASCATIPETELVLTDPPVDTTEQQPDVSISAVPTAEEAAEAAVYVAPDAPPDFSLTAPARPEASTVVSALALPDVPRPVLSAEPVIAVPVELSESSAPAEPIVVEQAPPLADRTVETEQPDHSLVADVSAVEAANTQSQPAAEAMPAIEPPTSVAVRAESEPVTQRVAVEPVEGVGNTPAPAIVPIALEPAVATTSTPESNSSIEVVGQEVEIRLPGSGWIYVGSEYGAGAVTLSGKRRESGDDLFTFELAEPGEYGLWFQQQNMTTGSFESQRVSVVRDDQPDPGSTRTMVAAAQVPRDTVDGADSAADGVSPAADHAENAIVVSPPDSADYSIAIRLLREGDVPGAFRSLLDQSRAYDPNYEDIDPDELAAFLSAARSAPGPTRRQFLDTLSSSDHSLSERATAELLGDASQDGNPGPLVTQVVSRGLVPGYEQGLDDRTLFTIATQLEQIGPGRDLREALRLYRLITERFPLSRYWEQSRSRAEHIERHYIDIR